MRQSNRRRSPVASKVSRFIDFSPQPLLELPEGRQELTVAGRFEAQGPVGTLCGVIVLSHPEHELGHAHLTLHRG